MSYAGTLSVEEIAHFMNKSPMFVRRSIENGSLPIGAYDRQGSRGSYYISPKRAEEYLGYVRGNENEEENLSNISFDDDYDGIISQSS